MVGMLLGGCVIALWFLVMGLLALAVWRGDDDTAEVFWVEPEQVRAIEQGIHARMERLEQGRTPLRRVDD